MVQSDVVYTSRDGEDLHVDIYRPSPDVPNQQTAIIVFHGGGFRAGDRTAVAARCEALAKHGFTVLAGQYRLLVGDVRWPAPLHDVKTLVAWVRDHADELDIDAERIVVQGQSAGAYLCLMAAATFGDPSFAAQDGSGPEARIAAVISFYGPSSVTFATTDSIPTTFRELTATFPEDGSGPYADLLLGPGGSEEEARRISPIEHVSPEFPPTAIFQGTGDRFGFLGARELYEKLRAAGVPAELHLVSQALHEYDVSPSYRDVAAAEVALFVKRHVSDPEGLRDEVLSTNPFAVMALDPDAPLPLGGDD